MPAPSLTLEYSDQLGAQSALLTWLAQALQRHQEANQIYMDHKFSELQASLEHAMKTGSAGTHTRDKGRSAKGLAANGPVAKMPMHEDEPAGGWPATPIEPSRLERPIVSEPKSQSVETTALDEKARGDEDDSSDEGERPVAAESSSSTMRAGVSMAKGACELLAVDGGVKAEAGTMVPLPSALMSARDLLHQLIWGNGSAEDNTCWAETLRLVNVAGVFVVSCNAVVLFLETEQQGAQIAGDLDIVPDVSGWDSMTDVFYGLDHTFNAFYVIEMIVKLVMMRRAYFKDVMNIIDAAVAMLNTLDLFVLKGSSSTLVLARLARLIKVSKLMRLSRIMAASNEICALVSHVYHSLKALAAATVLLMFVVFITGLGMAQFVSLFLMDECAPNVPLCEWAYRHYGSGSRAAWTMFQVTLSGGWPAWAADLVEEVNWFYITFWVVYVIVVWFGVLRVITALFLKQTMEIAAADQEIVTKEKLRKKAKYAAAMRNFFAASDVDGNGLITYAEFKTALLDKDAGQWLQGMGVEHTEIDALFQLLDGGDGHISFDELLANAARLGGTARASDQVAIICNQKAMLRRMEQLACDLGASDANMAKNAHAAMMQLSLSANDNA